MSTPATRSLFTILADVVAALEPLTEVFEGLQITPYLNGNPTPPSIDVYPSSPFQVGASFADWQIFLNVRARVSTADPLAGQARLLRLLDPTDEASVAKLLETIDPPIAVLEVSEYREYLEDPAVAGRLLGAEWRVATFL
jgi:hypothetical protein